LVHFDHAVLDGMPLYRPAAVRHSIAPRPILFARRE
jgi:hypothetical protein